MSSSNPQPTTTYGTIQTTTSTPELVPSNTNRYHRPWREFLKPSSFSLPESYQHALFRMQYNINHFKFNYNISLLFIMYLNVVHHTPSIYFLWYILFIFWYTLYFKIVGKGTLSVCGFLVGEIYVLLGLWIVTVVGLVLIGNGVSLLIVLCVGVLFVCLHAGFRSTEDLFLDEESFGGGGDHGDSAHALVSVVRS